MPMLVLCRTLFCNPCICPKMEPIMNASGITAEDMAHCKSRCLYALEWLILLTEHITKPAHQRPSDFWRLQRGVLMSLPLSCNRIRRLFNAGI
jgi:hypothetical protein